MTLRLLSFGSKILSIASVFLVAKVIISEFGAACFGVLSTIQLFSIAFSLADLGIGSSLVNRLVEAIDSNDDMGKEQVVRSALRNLAKKTAILFALLVLVVIAIYSFHYNVPEAALTAPSVAIIYFVAGLSYISQFFLVVFQRINLALGKNHRNFAFVSFGNVLQVLVAFGASRLGLSFELCSVGVLFAPTIASLMNALYSITIEEGWLRSAIKIKRSESLDLSQLEGGKFVQIQILSTVIFSLDIILVSSAYTSGFVAQYAIAQRFFGAFNQTVEPFIQAQWPKFYGIFLKEGSRGVQRKFTNMIGLTALASAIPILFLVLIFPFVLKILKLDEIAAPLVAGFASWTWLALLAGIACSVMSSSRYVDRQAKNLLLIGIVVVPLKVALTAGTHLGWVIPICNAIASLAILASAYSTIHLSSRVEFDIRP